MQLGKSLIGALIGGVLGIVVLVLVHSLTGWDKYWMAIPVAICTGLGVRWVATTKGHPSYVRGVLTGVVAILAFLVGQYVVAEVATRLRHAPPIVADLSDVRAADEAETADETGEPDGAAEVDAANETDEAAAADDTEQTAQDAAPAQPPSADEGARQGPTVARPQRVQPWSTIDLISLCVAALVGYALGRGSDSPAHLAGGVHDDSAPAAPNRTVPPSD